MLPETEADSIPVDTDKQVVYSEGMETSYRSSTFQAAFPFGHGLTYTGFEYSPVTNETCAEFEPFEPCELRMKTMVKNVGDVTASTVAQLYLELPAQAGWPKPFLKGFKRTSALAPGESEQVVFELSRRDLSYYDVNLGDYTKASGTFHAHVGESSADIRRTLRFCVDGCDSGSSPPGLMILAGASLVLTGAGIIGWLLVGRKQSYKKVDEASLPFTRVLQHDA